MENQQFVSKFIPPKRKCNFTWNSPRPISPMRGHIAPHSAVLRYLSWYLLDTTIINVPLKS